jgi:hypothetical protein
LKVGIGWSGIWQGPSGLTRGPGDGWGGSILAELWDIRPSRMRILRLVLMLFVSMHLFACIYWRIKVPIISLLLCLTSLQS